MSPRPYSSDSESRPEPELVIMDGDEMEAKIDNGMFTARLASIHGRAAARAFAYSMSGEDPKTAKAVLKIVEREG